MNQHCAAFRRAFLLLAILLLLFPAVLSHADAALDEKVVKIFKNRKTVGGAVFAARDGEILYEYYYGFADKIAKEHVSEETYFKVASVSKMVTGITVMRLWEQGLLDLDANVGDVLGDPPYNAANPYFPKIPLTLRHLMTHTSSIKANSGFQKNRALSLMLNVKNKRRADFYNEKPGSVYRYSNYGAGIEGCIIEAVTGKRLSEAAQELLFQPMGIDAAYHPSRLQSPEKIVTTYESDGSIEQTRARRLRDEYKEEPDPDHDYHEAYGSLWIRGRDLCRIGIMLCDGGRLDGRQILQPATVQEMMSSQEGNGYVTVDSPYGLNIERVNNLLSGRLLYGHQGLANGILCNVYYDPESRFVFTLVTNGCNSAKEDHIGILSRRLFDLLWSEYGSGT